MGGVRSQHVTTLQGMEILTKSFHNSIGALPGLPDSVRELIHTPATDGQICKALIQAGQFASDSGQPSWAVLGRMVQETRFAQVCRRAHFMRYGWSVSPDEFVDQALPLIGDHPYLPFFLSYKADRRRDAQKFVSLLQGLPWTAFETHQTTRTRVFSDLTPRDTNKDTHWVWCSDWIYRDYSLILDGVAGDFTLMGFANDLQTISPHAPIARATLVKADWTRAQTNAAAWEKESQHPRLLLELGKRYQQLKRFEDAERCLNKSIALSPDEITYRQLAIAYKSQNKMDNWLQALEGFLSQEDPGLGHAKVRVEIAEEFMRRKDWTKALPYAEAAAESYAEWALKCAAECSEGAGNWAKSEMYYRRASERYAASYFLWCYWCLRTGKGDIAAADQFYVAIFNQLGAKTTVNDVVLMSAYHTLTNRNQKAVEILRPVYQRVPGELLAMYLLLACDEIGDQQGRDQVLQSFPGKEPPMKQLAELFRACLAKGEKGDLDLRAVDALMAKLEPMSEAEMACYVGRFLDKRGQAQAATQYLTRCAMSPEKTVLAQTFATVRLRARGVDVLGKKQ